MLYYNLFIQSFAKYFFKLFFLPYKIISILVSYYISLKVFSKHKEFIIPYIQKNATVDFSSTKKKAARTLFYLSYDDPINVGWRKFKSNKINKWAISLIVWMFLMWKLSYE